MSAETVLEQLRFVSERGGGYTQLAEDCIALIERQGAELALANEAANDLRAALLESPAGHDRQRIEDWFRSLKRSLSYNGEWKAEDDEIVKTILNGLGVES